MDRTILLGHREQTLWRIAQGAKLVAHQEELVRRLQGAGLSTDRAQALLSALHAAQESHKASLARIEGELTAPPPPSLEG